MYKNNSIFLLMHQYVIIFCLFNAYISLGQSVQQSRINRLSKLTYEGKVISIYQETEHIRKFQVLTSPYERTTYQKEEIIH